MVNIDKIYVCHHKPLIERRFILEESLNILGVNVEWVENFSPEEIRDKYNELVGEVIIDPNAKPICQDHYDYYPNAGTRITIPELSLYLKHKYCIENQLNNNYKNILILEDDVIINKDFVDFINKCMFEFNQTDGDMMFTGTDFNFHVRNIIPNKYVYINENQLTRCAHSYVVNIKCAEKILNRLYPINFPWDFKLNEIIILEKLKVAWTEPCMYQNKSFPTTLQNK